MRIVKKVDFYLINDMILKWFIARNIIKNLHTIIYTIIAQNIVEFYLNRRNRQYSFLE